MRLKCEKYKIIHTEKPAGWSFLHCFLSPISLLSAKSIVNIYHYISTNSTHINMFRLNLQNNWSLFITNVIINTCKYNEGSTGLALAFFLLTAATRFLATAFFLGFLACIIFLVHKLLFLLVASTTGVSIHFQEL